MHILASLLYAVIAFAALVAYCLATGAPLLVLLVSPLLISGAIIVFMLLDLVFVAGRWLWRNRATLRLWRSP